MVFFVFYFFFGFLVFWFGPGARGRHIRIHEALDSGVSCQRPASAAAAGAAALPSLARFGSEGRGASGCALGVGGGWGG